MQTLTINQRPVLLKEYKGQRVVTLKDIDLVHERPKGTARRNFNENKTHLIEGTDYFVRNSYEAKTEFGLTAPNGLTLLTESGYLMLIKSLRTIWHGKYSASWSTPISAPTPNGVPRPRLRPPRRKAFPRQPLRPIRAGRF